MPWSVIVGVSWRSLRRRLLRSMITMVGVILGIAFLVYMLVTDYITQALVAMANQSGAGTPLNASERADLSRLLQEKGVDLVAEAAGTSNEMYLLIGLALLICLVGIINSMLMSVSERIKEIGTLKCLGAMDSFVVKSYFVESSLQGVIGTVIGLILGLVVALVVAVFAYAGFLWQAMPWARAAMALGVGLVVGSLLSVVASVGPAFLAARKEPVEAMREEE